jgi:hypothetical protein
MGLPNLNPNNNLVCDNGASNEGFIFGSDNNANGNMTIAQGANTLLSIPLMSVAMPVTQYTSQQYIVKANTSVMVNVNSVLSSDGEVQFIAFVAVYPSTDADQIVVDPTQQYIQFQYPVMGGGYLNLGQIMILSGTTPNGTGWQLGSSPGGITLFNPHLLFDVTVTVLAFN